MTISLMILAATMTIIIVAAVKVGKQTDEWEEERWEKRK